MRKPRSKPREKPAEYGAFESLTKKLLGVPKEELDRKMAKYESDKRKAAK